MNATRISRTCLSLLLVVLLLPSTTYTLTAKVIKVSDGDTITVITPDYQQIRVRLYGIDCPERRQPFGTVATRFTADKVAGKMVDVEEFGRDRYGHVIGIVGQLNQDLIEAGLAWIYPQYCKKSFCKDWERLEKQARSQKRGLWKEPNPVAPWEIRNVSRKTVARNRMNLFRKQPLASQYGEVFFQGKGAGK